VIPKSLRELIVRLARENAGRGVRRLPETTPALPLFTQARSAVRTHHTRILPEVLVPATIVDTFGILLRSGRAGNKQTAPASGGKARAAGGVARAGFATRNNSTIAPGPDGPG